MSRNLRNSDWTVGCDSFTDKKRDFDLPDNFLKQKLSEDGNSYIEISFDNSTRIEKTVLECGKMGVTSEWLIEVDSLDAKLIGNEIQEQRLKDFSFGRVKDECHDSYIFLHSDKVQKTVHEQAFSENKVLSGKAKIVHDVVESLTPKQRFVYDLRCDRSYPMSYPDIAECFSEFFHCQASDDSVRNLFKKVQNKVCKALNEWPEKKKK